MAKPILQYKVNTVVNPLTQEKVYTPMLTDRAPAVSLETVVKSAKDKGYLPGLKDVSAKALAEGVLSSLKDTLAAGTNVKFARAERQVRRRRQALQAERNQRPLPPGRAYQGRH